MPNEGTRDGPWEVFQDVTLEARGPDPENDQSPFRLYSVAVEKAAVRVSGGLQIVPDFSVDTAPVPHVVVVPALRPSPPLLEWLKRASLTADIVMSVCTGAFALGRAGLLGDGPATTHHLYLDQLAQQFPSAKVERERLATAGGLTSCIDLALRGVERYFGRKIASQTAEYMEYQSRPWIV